LFTVVAPKTLKAVGISPDGLRWVLLGLLQKYRQSRSSGFTLNCLGWRAEEVYASPSFVPAMTHVPRACHRDSALAVVAEWVLVVVDCNMGTWGLGPHLFRVRITLRITLAQVKTRRKYLLHEAVLTGIRKPRWRAEAPVTLILHSSRQDLRSESLMTARTGTRRTPSVTLHRIRSP